MPITKLRPTFTFTQDRLDELKAIVPEAFADGKINWETLREALGDYLEEEGREAEHFGLFWPGKRAARRLAALPSKGTLLPAPGEGVDEGSTRNIFIEGDNLEVLKLLQKSYAGRVKLIYIDPPYNTGHDLVYHDDFRDPLEGYLQKTGQVDEKGVLLTTNAKTDGRFHSNWLSMMYPRLSLARQLLREDGVIFVSIDDNEAHNLRMLMNELFGEENFVDCVVWQKKVSPSNDAKWFSSDHDYVLVYARSKEIWRPRRLPRNARQEGYYKNPDNDPRGPWNSATYTCNKSKNQRPNLYYPIINPNTGEEIWPKETAVWAYSKEQHQTHVAESRLYYGVTGTATMPRLKTFLSEAGNVVPRSIWLYSEVGHTQEATSEFLEFFPGGGFSSPKPSRLIRRILQLSTDAQSEDIVLDFFSGSCTTAQAVLEANREDEGNRRFVTVQLPEPTDNKFSTIAEIGKGRIRRVIAKMKQEARGKLNLSTRETPEDLGFKVYKLGRSNFQAWQDYHGENIQQLEALFDSIETPLVDDWQAADLLAEIMLLEGFPLDSVVTQVPDLKRNQVMQLESDACVHRLFVCLDKKIKDDTIQHLTLGREDVLVCLDSALTDEAKARLSDQHNLRTI